VLRAKYGRGICGVDNISVKATYSHTWCGVAENINVLRRGSGIAVGNGHSTSFWTQKWVGPEALIDLATCRSLLLTCLL